MEEIKDIQKANLWFQMKQKNLMEDSLAMAYMQPLIKDIYLPYSGYALRPHNLAVILNDIVINGRHNILEFGSGISTIIIARLIRQNNLNAKIISVDHDKEWIGRIQELIDRENLGEIISLIHAPLKDSSLSLNENSWYDEGALESVGNTKIDMVIIDGPPAWEPQKQEARYPAFPFVHDKLAEKSVVFLDDAERKGERSIVQKWEEGFNVKFWAAGGTLACYNRGDWFSPTI